MWPSGRGQVPHPAAFQNVTVYNPGGYPEVQNQQGTIFPASATYPPCVSYSEQARPASYLQQSLSAPYLQQAFPVPYPQQVSRARSQQEIMAGDMVLLNQDRRFQNRYRRESMLEYQNGEVVMVRCNQQKWLHGIIQRMAAQGLRIWIADANILVNVPLVLVPTHVLKMSMYSELQALPPREPLWTMTVTDNAGCRKALVQCVRPAHLSHRQLFHKFGCIECALCKTTVSSIDVVSPWNCSHQVHNYCLQLRMQHSSTSVCPSCNEMGTSQPMPVPSTGDDSTLQLMPSTFTGIGSTSQLMPSPSTSNALVSTSNEQHQQWLDLQCACGFRGSIDSACIDNKYAPVFCPNCHQPVNMIPMTIGLQSEKPFSSMNLPHTYSEVDREILKRKNVQDHGFGWLRQSFSRPSRLEAIEEGSREGICSTPPSPDQTDEEREEPSYLPSYLVAFGETFENGMSDPDVAVSSVNQNMQPSPSSRSSWQDGILTAAPQTQFPLIQSGQPSPRNSLQDGTLTKPSPSPVTLIETRQSSARSSLQDGVLTAPSPTQYTLIQTGQSSARSSWQDGLLQELTEHISARTSLQDGTLATSSPTQNTPIQNGQSCARSSSQDGSLDAPSSTRITLIRDEESRDNAPSSEEVLIGPAAFTQVNHMKLTEVQEAEELSEKVPETETTTVAAPDTDANRQKFWRRAREVDWIRKNFDEDSDKSEEVSSSNDFAAVAPRTPPVYVNHFANFVKLAMASASTAKEILASASTSSSSSSTDPPPLKSPTPAWIIPAPAIVTPAPAFFTRGPALVTEAPAIVTPAHLPFFSRAPGLITETPAWATVVKDPNGGDASSAWITVIKDGVDSRKEDAKQWELDRLARKKEAEFF